MANQASAEEIVKFLVKAKKLLSMGEYIMIPRRKNMQSAYRFMRMSFLG